MGAKIGIALGSGSARGWAHIGVLNRLSEKGIRPTLVSGTSAGSLVGAAYAAGVLPEFEAWVRSLEWSDVVSFLDISLDGGLIKGKKLFDFFRSNYPGKVIEELSMPYGAVATDLEMGTEVWLRSGPLLDAVRASLSLPGIFTPVYREGRILVDGGLVNPVPVSLCRAMGADVVIAVDLNTDLLSYGKESILRRKREVQESGEYLIAPQSGELSESGNEEESSFWQDARAFLTGRFWGRDVKERLSDLATEKPSIIEVVSRSINVMQARITRSRMAGDPPDLFISPRLRHIGFMEYHRAVESIEEGRRSVDKLDLDFLKEGVG